MLTVPELLLSGLAHGRQHGVLELGADVAEVPHLSAAWRTMVVETGSLSVISFLGGSGCRGCYAYSIIFDYNGSECKTLCSANHILLPSFSFLYVLALAGG